MIPFAVITVAAVCVATFYVLKAMDEIFGKAVYPEKGVVKKTLLVILLVVFWRVFGLFALGFGAVEAAYFYEN